MIPIACKITNLFNYQALTAQRLKVYRTLGPTACLKMLTEKTCLKKMHEGEKSMIAPRQPQT